MHVLNLLGCIKVARRLKKIAFTLLRLPCGFANLSENARLGRDFTATGKPIAV